MSADWMNEEEERANENADNDTVENEGAPKLIRQKQKAPARNTRNVYVQDDIWKNFETAIFMQKMAGGKSKPELAEEALQYIYEKYGKQ